MGDGVSEIISEFELPVTYKLFDSELLHEPLSMNMFVTDPGEAGYELKLSGKSFEATIPEGFEITNSTNVSVRDTGTNWIATGTGNGSINIRPKAETINNTTLLSDVSTAIMIKKSDASVATVPVLMKKIPGYFLQEGTKLKKPVLITNPGKIRTITFPDAVIGEAISHGSIDKWRLHTPTKSIDKLTINPEVILTPIDGPPIKVIYPGVSENFVQFTSPANGVNYTKTLADINFTTTNNNDHFEVELHVAGKEYTYKVPAFQGSAKINLGDAIHRNLRFNYPDMINTSENFSIPNFDIFTYHYRNGIQIGKKANMVNPILKGWNPEQVNNIAILSHCKVSRHSKNSFTIVNVMWLGEYITYSMYINGVQQYPTQMVGNTGIASIKVNFRALGVQDGDVVDFELKSGTNTMRKTFVIQPALESKILIYEDSFGLRSVLECTGLKTKIENELDIKQETAYVNRFFHQRKFNVAEENTLTINTGFLLQSQFIEVEELLKSPVVKLWKNDWTFIDLVPKTDKTVILDRQQHLKSYQLEFHINQKKYAQDYKL